MMKDIENVGEIQFFDDINKITYVYKKPTDKQVEKAKKEKTFLFEENIYMKLDQ